MQSIFQSAAAFAPMFDDQIVVECVRNGVKHSTTCRACVLDIGLDDPIGENSIESRRRIISVSVNKNDLLFVSGGPNVGDVLKNESGDKFIVESVSSPLGCTWDMEARSA